MFLPWKSNDGSREFSSPCNQIVTKTHTLYEAVFSNPIPTTPGLSLEAGDIRPLLQNFSPAAFQFECIFLKSPTVFSRLFSWFTGLL